MSVVFESVAMEAIGRVDLVDSVSCLAGVVLGKRILVVE